MKTFNKLSGFVAMAIAVSAIFGCQQEELVKPDALLSESSLTFEAKGAEPQTFMVASDDDWIIDVKEDWITTDLMSGSQTMDVTVTVADNVTDGAMNAPRQGTITILNKRGYSVKTVIYQKGDTYLGIDNYTVSEVAALDDEAKAKISEASVLAVSASGFVMTDETTTMYAEGIIDGLKAGDKIFLNGTKTTIGGFPAFKADEIEVLSSEEITYPEPVEISGSLPETITYITVSGTLVGNLIQVNGVNGGQVLNAPESMELSKLNIHKVMLTGYYVGVIDKLYSIVLTAVKDEGTDAEFGKDLPFKDDFSWLTPMIEKYNAANSVPVGNTITGWDKWQDAITNTICPAPNVYTAEPFASEFQEAFAAMGYRDLNPEHKVIYAQDTYLKVNKTGKDSRTALQLPYFKISEPTDLLIQFDWACMLQGSGTLDNNKMKLIIEGDGQFENGTKISDEIQTDQKSSENFKWTHASVKVTGATASTGIILVKSPAFNEDGTFDLTTDSSIGRFFIDNIEVMSSADAIQANIVIDGLENDLITFEGTPEAPVSFTVSSDREFSVTTDVKWLTIEGGEGLAGAENTVTVTCEPSTLSTLRRTEIIVKSGVTVKRIPVVQSAAGQELEPFISIIGGNSKEVIGEKSQFSVDVQANVPVTAVIEPESEWITEIASPATKALVEKTTYTFETQANLTGAPRTGRIKFINTEEGIESVITISQENFEPRIALTYNPLVDHDVTKLIINIETNVKIDKIESTSTAITTEPSISEQEYTFTVTPVSSTEIVTMKFTNNEYSLTKEITLCLVGEKTELFSDDFSWCDPIITVWNATEGNSKIGKSVEDQNASGYAPNLYTKSADLTTAFFEGFNEKGYVDLNAELKVLYLQDAYLKFGMTGKHSGLKLPAMSYTGNAVVSFDWCAHMTGSGNIDKVQMVVEIEGEGEVVTSSGTAKISDPIASTQTKGRMFWMSEKVAIIGLTPESRINIRPLQMNLKPTEKPDQQRFHLDNIKVEAAN